MASVDHGHEAEVNAEVGAALLATLRAWIAEETAKLGPCQPEPTDEDGSDEEVA